MTWAWNPALRTAIGYQGFFGGLDYFSTPRTGTVNTGKSFEQQLRGAAQRIGGVEQPRGELRVGDHLLHTVGRDHATRDGDGARDLFGLALSRLVVQAPLSGSQPGKP